jgi:NADPH:quinone reductase-like Zn-dependent oxidoreductase
MKKVVFNKTGDPKILRIIEVSEPKLKKNEVLINLKSIGLNWSEVMIRCGDWPLDLSGGFTPGVEGVGLVEAVGEEVRSVRPGDKVANFDVDAYLENQQGNYAEKIAVAENKILKLPGDMSIIEAGAHPSALLTAYDALINHSPLPESGTVLITACTGGVGIAALKIATLKGLRVIGTTRSEEKVTMIEDLGVQAVVANDSTDLYQKVSDIVGMDGVDYIFDSLNGDVATDLLGLLNPNGTFVSYGFQTGEEFTVDVSLIFNQIKIHGYGVLQSLAQPKSLQKVWKDILPLLEEKEISIPIAKTFPFQEVAEAHKYFESHEHFGKILLIQ